VDSVLVKVRTGVNGTVQFVGKSVDDALVGIEKFLQKGNSTNSAYGQFQIPRDRLRRTFANRATPMFSSLPTGLTEEFALSTIKIAQWQALLQRNKISPNWILGGYPMRYARTQVATKLPFPLEFAMLGAMLKAAQILGLTILLIAITAIATPFADARAGYRLAAQEQYRLLDKAGKGEIGCIYCHTSPNGGTGWNKFGEQLRELYFGNARRNVGDMLYMALRSNKDSDNDGYSDVLEVVAKTLPGDPSSKPSVSVTAVQAELTKVGGVDSFKPKR
jgi:hypothetical protein